VTGAGGGDGGGGEGGGDRVDRALRELREAPPPRASTDFTARVLARVDEVEGRRRWWRGRAGTLTASAAGALAATMGLVLALRPHHRAPDVAETAPAPVMAVASADGGLGGGISGGGDHEMDGEVAALWREQRALSAELEQLRAQARPLQRSSVIYVGHTDGVDLVLDLAAVGATGAQRRRTP
jgi:hypothetical protein